ncbi:OsmC family protein [Capnocytophaga stomatis]|uniref:OsmC family protein n=1 Tax=Capnocytophaga stomatis TaxID=1848904 RepID=UPI001AD0FBE6|nr:OsmC family protein [Capnocytophaga stomatis]GIM48718.1 OsmC-like protein [Capnocytophaga stomatis]
MHQITTIWKGDMLFSSNNPGGEILIDAGVENGGKGQGLRPKALMLSALAGCSGLDIASLIRKMKLEVDEFKIETFGELTEEHPQVYHIVRVEYHFSGTNLNEERLQRTVDLSVEKYCGVMQMFKQFAKIEIKVFFHKNKLFSILQNFF